MTIKTNCTDRKVMVRQLAETLNQKAQYLGTPSYAYSLGNLTVDRDGNILGEKDDLKAVALFLLENQYIETISEEMLDLETEEPAQCESQSYMSLSISELEPTAFCNLIKLLYARQNLIAAMMQSDCIYIDEEVINLLQDEKPDSVEKIQEMLESEIKVQMIRGISIQEGHINIGFPFADEQSPRWGSYAVLLSAIATKAVNAHHISSKRVEPQEEEMKYFCRNWLIQLGLGGADHKEDQHVLLDHLHGYAAFRSADKMNAHKAKYAAIRKEKREENKAGESRP